MPAQKNTDEQLAGCIVATVTPMKPSGAIDYPAYRRLVNWFIAEGVDAICAVGTTGESTTLDPREHSEMIAKTVAFAAGRVPVVAGTGANSTAEAIALTKDACSDGADFCLSVVPYYNRPPQDGLRKHFESIADAASKPVILYNVPARTACDLADETVGKLARHPNIVGIKDATGNIMRQHRIRRLAGARFVLLSGDDASGRVYLANGGAGTISVTANVAPGGMSRMVAAARAGKHALAARIDSKMEPFHAVQGVQANPIPTKWALHAARRIGPGIRLPLVPLASQYRAAVVKAARAAAAA